MALAAVDYFTPSYHAPRGVLLLGVRIEERLGNERARTAYADQILRDFPQSPEARTILESG